MGGGEENEVARSWGRARRGRRSPGPNHDSRYSWVIVVVLATTETISWGALYYSFAVFIDPMQRELGWTRTELTGAYSIALLVSAIAAFPVGRWLDTHSPRVLMTAASAAAVGLLLAWSQVHTVAAFYAIWCGLGLAMAALLYEAAFTIVTKWFVERRRQALTAVTLVAGLASFIFLPVVNWLVEQQGWRAALVGLAVIVAAVTVPLHGIFLRDAPSDEPYHRSDRDDRGQPSIGPAAAISTRSAAKSGSFWLLTASFALSAFSTSAVAVHLIPYLVGVGYDGRFAAIAGGLVGLMQIPGRIVFATVLQALPRRAEPAAAFLLQAAGLAVLAVAALPVGVIVAVLLFGAGNGMATLIRALAISQAYGSRSYGSIAGLSAAWTIGARAAAPVATSGLYAIVGDYRPIFWLLTGASTAAAIAGVLGSGSQARSHRRSSRCTG